MHVWRFWLVGLRWLCVWIGMGLAMGSSAMVAILFDKTCNTLPVRID